MAKRPCLSDHSPRVSKGDNDRLNIDALLESLFAIPDCDLIDASFVALVESRSTDQNDFIQHALHLGSVLLEAVKRTHRKCSSVHNASVWPFPPELTIKVFSMLDTPSVCSASATCSFFQKCAMDPLCFANIDFATLVPKVSDDVVSAMIQRAGNALQSIKVGVQPPIAIRYFSGELPKNDNKSGQGNQSSILTSSCLSSLRVNGGALGSRLKGLHLYNMERMDNIALIALLLFCPSLVDLEIVGLNVDFSHTLETVGRYCGLIEHFLYKPSDSGRGDQLKDSVCEEFVLKCSKITNLTLKHCYLKDNHAHMLLKGFHELKYVDLTDSYGFTGACFLDLGSKCGLEVMILRDTYNLNMVEVKKFIKALIAGDFRLLRHLDISNNHGLAVSETDHDYRCYSLRCGGSSLQPSLIMITMLSMIMKL